MYVYNHAWQRPSHESVTTCKGHTMKQIEPVALWHTPENMDELTATIEAMNGAEKIAAWHGAMLAWNLACKLTNKEETA